MSGCFGTRIQLAIFGESHGPAIGITVDGLPPGLKLDMDFIESEMARRAPGQSALSTSRKEPDAPEILSGLLDGVTTGAPLCAVIRNTNQRSRDYGGLGDLVRPGHLTLLSLMEKMSANPARLYKMPFGAIAPGAPADVVLFDPDELWVPEGYSSKSSNSPFTGCPLYGKVHATICRGEVIYSRGR